MGAFLFASIPRRDSKEIQVSDFKHAALKIQQLKGYYLLTTNSQQPKRTFKILRVSGWFITS